MCVWKNGVLVVVVVVVVVVVLYIRIKPTENK
jgi:hypothetical protein